MRLIDADALIDEIKHGLWDWGSVDGIKSSAVLKQTISDINNMPTVDAEPVRHGKWIYEPKDAIEMMFTLPKCSECGFYSADGMYYCSCCGARMDLDEVKE